VDHQEAIGNDYLKEISKFSINIISSKKFREGSEENHENKIF